MFWIRQVYIIVYLINVDMYLARTHYLHSIVLCEYMWLPVHIHKDISIPYVCKRNTAFYIIC